MSGYGEEEKEMEWKGDPGTPALLTGTGSLNGRRYCHLLCGQFSPEGKEMEYNLRNQRGSFLPEPGLSGSVRGIFEPAVRADCVGCEVQWRVWFWTTRLRHVKQLS